MGLQVFVRSSEQECGATGRPTEFLIPSMDRWSRTPWEIFGSAAALSLSDGNQAHRPACISRVGSNRNQNLGGLRALTLDTDGSLWAGMELSGPGLGFQRFVQGAWKPFRTPELDGSTLAVNALLSDREHSLWIGTQNGGIYRISGGRVDHFPSADGLSGNLVNNLYEDREGNVWAVTSKGIDSLRDLPVASYSTREGLSTEEV